MINSGRLKGVKSIKEGNFLIMTFSRSKIFKNRKKYILYKMARESKILTVKVKEQNRRTKL